MRILSCLFMIGLAISGCDSLSESPATREDTSANDQAVEPAEPEEFCDDWGVLTAPGLLYENNVWGKGDISNYEQCLLKRSQNGTNQFGWRWFWPKASGQVKAFPEVVFGYKPWHSSSTTPLLPAPISTLANLTVSYDVELRAEGTYNLAFDIWVTSSIPPTPDTITHEVMIWVAQTFEAQPRQYFVTQVWVDNKHYDLYLHHAARSGTGADYIAFVSREPQFGGTLDLKQFIDYLVGEGHIPVDNHLASVELGNEIVAGSGELWFDQFQVTVGKNLVVRNNR